MYKRTPIDYFFLFLKGLAMGSANKVPGVSGGMIALVTGFYEEFIYSLQKVNRKAFGLLLNGRFVSFFNYLNTRFLIAIILGSVSAYFSVSLLLDYLIRKFEVFVWAFFFGMIIGSVYYISKDIKKWYWTSILLVIIGTTIGGSISFMDPLPPDDRLWFVFICGIVGVTGMTLPGFSGSFILILLGNYVLLLVDAVNNLFFIFADLFSFSFAFLEDPIRIKLLWIACIFSCGSLFGMVSFSHILGYLLKRYHDGVLSLLMGFILGSLGVAWPWRVPQYQKDEFGKRLLDMEGNPILTTFARFIPQEWNSKVFWAILFMIIGGTTILIIDYYQRKK